MSKVALFSTREKCGRTRLEMRLKFVLFYFKTDEVEANKLYLPLTTKKM